MGSSTYAFSPERYAAQLVALIGELDDLAEIDGEDYRQALRRHPKDGRGFFSKSEIIRGFRHLNQALAWGRDEEEFAARLRMKPVRTASGVAPVTLLTKPHPCPGRCIFCPSDVRMPKSYLSDEPGAQRAAQHRFDPYAQTLSRLRAYHHTGHRVDKAELIVLGGTWSSYHEEYQLWFVKRSFEALNDFARWRDGALAPPATRGLEWAALDQRIDGRRPHRSYNRIVSDHAQRHGDGGDGAETAGWDQLAEVQRLNETAASRCVGLVVETRPDHLTANEVTRLRRLGATKVQIGYQSLSDEVLAANHRGHDVAATRRAMRLLRGAGLKIHAHWMPNLYGSSPERDVEDYGRIFADPDFRPDELKIYPCSLIESAELMRYWGDGRWRPYDHDELLEVLIECLRRTPEYCRLTRVIRDIPGTDIVAGNRRTNFRELAEAQLARRGLAALDIRAREVRHRAVRPEELERRDTRYATSVGEERFLQYVTPDDRLAAFLRLSLPTEPVEIGEIARSAMIREVHVYGRLVGLGQRRAGRSQHLGLGSLLIEHAAELAAGAGFADLAVISAVGTRDYYRRLGFEDGELYQHRRLT
ncbi:MAG: elongator complex protein 3 [Thermoanaerobaculia bacterium]